jgi:glutamyl-tRNA synthetase
MSVRVRYAPSPTGLQHVGGVRTALFNYFFARSQAGTFILRLEDTDQERYDPAAVEDLYETFRWLGIHWDEGPDVGGPFGPYVQSERAHLYQQYTKTLLDNGYAYYCFCSEDRLSKLREEQARTKAPQGYDRHCRNLSKDEVRQALDSGIQPVVRFKIPLEGSTTVHDVLLGDIERENSDISPDPVLLKSDGLPTYHLANVVDDHLMEISHILRGQEWIPTGPLHVQLYDAFGWQPPQYCHLPMVLGEDGQKLSKRHGATSVQEFRRQGCLPEALINHIALVGWSYDDSRELFTVSELEELFSVERLNKASAVFDYRKLEWFNGVYIRQADEQRLADLLVPYLQAAGLIGNPPEAAEQARVRDIVPLVRERLRYLSDVAEVAGFLFTDELSYAVEDLVPKKHDLAGTRPLLAKARELLDGFEDRSDEENEQLFRDAAKAMNDKLGALLMPVRVAVTGSKASPPLFESIRVLGPDVARHRVDQALASVDGSIG